MTSTLGEVLSILTVTTGADGGFGQVNLDGAGRDRRGDIIGIVGASASAVGSKVRAFAAEGLVAADGIGGDAGEGALLLTGEADRHRTVIPAKAIGCWAKRGPNRWRSTVDLHGVAGLRLVARFVHTVRGKRLRAHAKITRAARLAEAVDNAAARY